MNETVKILWTEALDSGEFPQGFNALCEVDPNGGREFCCLGVLCEVAQRAEDGPILDVADGIVNDSRQLAYDGCISVLPDSVREWAWLDESDPLIPTDPRLRPYGVRAEVIGVHVRLSVVNDSAVPPSLIAQLIRDHL